ncbi:MAG: hypothetical protein HQ547_03115 [Candidatus Omnitrophica bacterium]|nr:hypothetical protein [Candidatus Omnitrophota bacterium]
MDGFKEPDTDQLHEELAKTYFSAASLNEDHLTKPKLPVREKKVKQFALGSILGIIGLLIIALLMFNKVEVTVNISPTVQSGPVSENQSPDRIYLSRGGELNRDVVKDIMFYGDADIKSGFKNEVFVLSCDANSRAAAMGIDFRDSIDMAENVFYFYAKSTQGQEELRISLRDVERNLCHSKINVLQDSWQRFVIDISQVRNLVDSKRITHIDFEINPKGKQGIARSAVYFKDMHFAKREK